jgi:hypothetical protein
MTDSDQARAACSRAEPRLGGVKASGSERSCHSCRDDEVERVLADVDADCCNGFKAIDSAWHKMRRTELAAKRKLCAKSKQTPMPTQRDANRD